MSSQPQRQRHGVHKNLAEGLGGLLACAALVLLARSVLRKRTKPSQPSGPSDRDFSNADPGHPSG